MRPYGFCPPVLSLPGFPQLRTDQSGWVKVEKNELQSPGFGGFVELD
jgi:hypothetical protein